jgi:hypothetical protein
LVGMGWANGIVAFSLMGVLCNGHICLSHNDDYYCYCYYDSYNIIDYDTLVVVVVVVARRVANVCGVEFARWRNLSKPSKLPGSSRRRNT